MQQSDQTKSTWYKEPWVWFILGLLSTSVVLGLSLLFISLKNPPSLVVDNYYDAGKGINRSLERESLATSLKIQAELSLDQERGEALLTLEGESQPPYLELTLISPTQPERDRRIVLQALPDQPGLYRGLLADDDVTGRRMVEVLGKEQEATWRLFEEENVTFSSKILLGEE
ncbi:hypothetical protein AKN88_02820 [Thiopseudomonas alkaliphila]|uniref:FixH protein n=1 Tax=Thiopseudomonas alkaliphila TaxID=1697053 RepID=A0A0K1XCT0_9GAMM|nr:FixH family protein [Thiopseudomonas alkaliphila]AKX58987.1 hypothetical protein AKN88_02820 [Thiopseudomonas alkaliphila]